MKSVLEALLARQEQGPFLLELFDSSEYSLVVPGEGPLPDTNPATWLSGAGQAMYQGLKVAVPQVPAVWPTSALPSLK